MFVLVFDTETTGLPIGRNPSCEDTDKWPHIVQLSYILYDTKRQKSIEIGDNIIKLDPCVKLPKESIKIHGISRQRMVRHGIPMKEALKEFISVLKKATILVCHNINFDRNMIKVEARRNRMVCIDDILNQKKEFCTMINGIDVCKIERVNRKDVVYFKFPNLSELHNCIFGKVPRGVHDSMVDVLITFKCFLRMTDLPDIVNDDIRSLYWLYEIDE